MMSYAMHHKEAPKVDVVCIGKTLLQTTGQPRRHSKPRASSHPPPPEITGSKSPGAKTALLRQHKGVIPVGKPPRLDASLRRALKSSRHLHFLPQRRRWSRPVVPSSVSKSEAVAPPVSKSSRLLHPLPRGRWRWSRLVIAPPSSPSVKTLAGVPPRRCFASLQDEDVGDGPVSSLLQQSPSPRPLLHQLPGPRPLARSQLSL